MKRRCAFCLLLVMGIVPLMAQESAPDPGSFEVEPPLLVQPDGKPIAQPEPSPTENLDVAQLEKKLERGRKSAASAERLWKAGVLAKLEAEQRALRVVRLEAELTKAQLAEVQKSAAINGQIVQTKNDQQEGRDEPKLTVAEATAAAETASANLAKAELDAALTNLERQKKLFTLGSARKSDIAHAEEKLAALKRGQQ